MRTKREQQKSNASTWYGWFFGGRSDAPTSSTSSPARAGTASSAAGSKIPHSVATSAVASQDPLSEAGREALFAQIDDGPETSTFGEGTTLPGEPFLATYISLKLARGSFVLLGRPRVENPENTELGASLAEFAFSGLSCAFRQWLGGQHKGISVDAELQRVTLHDRRQSQEGARAIIGPKPASLLAPGRLDSIYGSLLEQQRESSFLKLAFALHKPEAPADLQLALQVQPLQVLVDPTWLTRLARDFAVLQADDHQALSASLLMPGTAGLAGRRDGTEAQRRGRSGTMGSLAATNGAADAATDRMTESVWRNTWSGQSGPGAPGSDGSAASVGFWTWSIILDVDISAPLIVLADSSQMSHPTLQHYVVIDLGCLRAHNARSRSRQVSAGSETFQTPPSTPPESPLVRRSTSSNLNKETSAAAGTAAAAASSAAAGLQGHYANRPVEDNGEKNKNIATGRSPLPDHSDNNNLYKSKDAALARTASVPTGLGLPSAPSGDEGDGNDTDVLEEVQTDLYLIELSNVQMIAVKGDEWQQALQSASPTRYHVVHGFTVFCQARHSRSPTLPMSTPRFAVNGNLPLMSLALSESRLESIMACSRDLGRALSAFESHSGSRTPQIVDYLEYAAQDDLSSAADAAATRAGTELNRSWHGEFWWFRKERGKYDSVWAAAAWQKGRQGVTWCLS